jgi:hypothetical protein
MQRVMGIYNEHMELTPQTPTEDPLIWRPYAGMQTKMLQTKAFECMAGGARGPGKTMAGLVWLIKPYLLRSSQARSLVIRKNSEDLVDWLDRARYHYAAYGGVVSGKPAVIKFPSGYTIRTGHLKDDNAFTKYQGQEYQRILIEELTQIPTEKQYLQLLASCRSTIPGVDSRAMATTNPGGIGHQWVKKRFVDPSAWGKIFMGNDTGRLRVFYPGLLDDNTVLMENDPGYVKYLDGLKLVDVELWKAWRNGDWNVFSGMFFKNWRDYLHVTPAFIPYPNSLIVSSMDWGRNSKPSHQAAFCFTAAVVEKVYYNNDYFHRVKTFLEVAGKEKNVKEWSGEIKEKLKDFGINIRQVAWTRGDPAMFTKGLDLSLSIADQFMDEGILIEPASNDRIGGWEAMKKWLSLAPDGWPYYQITDNCRYLVSSLPSLIYDDKKVEDLDSDGDDHGADTERYKLKHLRWIDAHAGAVLTDQLNATKKLDIIVKDGKQQGLDLAPFEKVNIEGNTRVIGG